MGSPEMLFLSDDAIAGALDYPGLVAELDLAFQDLAQEQAVIHARQRSRVGDARLNTMGGIWKRRGVAAVKCYTSVAGQFSFLVTLFDTHENRPLAVLAGAELTKYRTAAQTALLANKLVTQPLNKLALFGAGFQGRAQLEAIISVLQCEEIAVVDPYVSIGWCEEFAKSTGIRTHLSAAEAAVRGAGLVVTATRSAMPVLDGSWLDDRAVVVAIGTSTAAGRELDDVTMDRASSIVVEWKPQSLQEAGELVLWSRREECTGKIVDLTELYSADAMWPRDGIVVVKSVGTGLSDVVAAWLAFDRLDKKHPSEVSP
jgi:ornithine cyclodeaminase